MSGFVDEFVTDGPGAVPTFGAGIFWQFGGSYASELFLFDPFLLERRLYLDDENEALGISYRWMYRST